jgi:hypothetical protein
MTNTSGLGRVLRGRQQSAYSTNVSLMGSRPKIAKSYKVSPSSRPTTDGALDEGTSTAPSIPLWSEAKPQTLQMQSFKGRKIIHSKAAASKNFGVSYNQNNPQCIQLEEMDPS